jgi:hypothetical protein
MLRPVSRGTRHTRAGADRRRREKSQARRQRWRLIGHARGGPGPAPGCDAPLQLVRPGCPAMSGTMLVATSLSTSPISMISRQRCHLLARCTTMIEGEDHAALGRRVVITNCQEQAQAEPGVIFALQLGTNTAAHRLIANWRLAAALRCKREFLARRGRVEPSKLWITHATVDRRARTLFARHSSSCRRLCRICVRRG